MLFFSIKMSKHIYAKFDHHDHCAEVGEMCTEIEKLESIMIHHLDLYKHIDD